METGSDWPRRAAVFGASGGIGAAFCLLLVQRGTAVLAGSRSGLAPQAAGAAPFRFDLEDEASLDEAARLLAGDPPDLVILATGLLTLPDGTGPEKSLKALDPSVMERIFRINTIGPATLARRILPLLPKDRRSVFAALSAKVGSIADNQLGGWHSYRASKAALNMLIRNFSIELGRSHPQAVVAALHPGTVDTALSAPFQGNVPSGRLFSPEQSASHLLDVLARLTPADSGGLFGWDGKRIPF